MKSAPAPSIPDPSPADPRAGFKRLLNLPLPPGPRGLPIFGNVFSLLWRGGNFDQYDAWVKRKYGDVALSRLLGAWDWMDVRTGGRIHLSFYVGLV